MKPLVVWGASGHARVVAEAARASGWSIVGFLDDWRPDDRTAVLGEAGLLGTLDRWLESGARVPLALGVGDNRARLRLLDRLEGSGVDLVTIVHPAAVISPTARIGRGTVVMAGSVVQAGAAIGDGVILNTRCGVDHDGVIGRGCHVSVGATLAGRVTLGEGSMIGPGAVVAAGMQVGEHAVIGAGAVVVRPVPAGTVAWGVPARPVDGTGVTA